MLGQFLDTFVQLNKNYLNKKADLNAAHMIFHSYHSIIKYEHCALII